MKGLYLRILREIIPIILTIIVVLIYSSVKYNDINFVQSSIDKFKEIMSETNEDVSIFVKDMNNINQDLNKISGLSELSDLSDLHKAIDALGSLKPSVTNFLYDLDESKNTAFQLFKKVGDLLLCIVVSYIIFKIIFVVI